MNKQQAVILLISIFSFSAIFGQDKIANFGVKGGINYGKYTPNQNSIEYKYQLGFYVGGFYKTEITNKLKFQPELLFAVQGSKINTKDNPLTDFKYDISKSLSLNIRAFTGLIKRDDIKSFVFNFGIEYNL
jgi:hypothetical protein